MREEGILSAGPLPDDSPVEVEAEATLRPRTMADFIGQTELKDRLQILSEAAQGRGEALDHILFSGPPGLGKTSLAGILAAEMDARITITSGPALERAGDLAAVLTNLEAGGVLFVDEIHRLPRIVEEVLYPAMEDFRLDVVVGKGPGARSIRLELPPFTLIGATTRVGRVAPPLRDRFGYVARIDYYEPPDLEAIVTRSAAILEVAATPDGAKAIALRSRGTPRIANRLLRRVRDYATVRADGVVDSETTAEALVVFEVDALGLDQVDRSILRAVAEKFGGGPVGLSTLAIAVGEEPETVEDAYEPFLMQLGMLKRTPRGRVATPAAYDHLGLVPPATPAGDQARLLE
ncbi:MAG: Holliday junction branch migration DNA helicase RuvB [Acidimicrobiia bacterium]|nr:Holliday junction branch migration DNA helicase RuvB [Acidimicrobiia bacterium]MDH3470808.1 Holliday junction branch migration DNA helicase RuvB [Acidimicrobiia bacterium]